MGSRKILWLKAALIAILILFAGIIISYWALFLEVSRQICLFSIGIIDFVSWMLNIPRKILLGTVSTVLTGLCMTCISVNGLAIIRAEAKAKEQKKQPPQLVPFRVRRQEYYRSGYY